MRSTFQALATDTLLGDQSVAGCTLFDADGRAARLRFANFVSPRAGAYFFAPSIAALRGHLGA